MPRDDVDHRFLVRGTEPLPGESTNLRSQKLARVLLNSVGLFVCLMDSHGAVLEVSPVELKASGIRLSEVEGKRFWDTFWWQASEKARAGLEAAVTRAAAGETVVWETSIMRRAGATERRGVEATLRPIRNDKNEVVFLCAECRDITEQLAAREKQQELERESAQKAVELAALHGRIRDLGDELRTPLALILGPAQRLVDDDGDLDREQRRESAQVVTRHARTLLRHVNELVDLARVEGEPPKLEREDVDVAVVVRLLASQFAVLARERNVTFVVEANAPCVAAVDPNKLQRVLMNLLGHAFELVPAGGRIRCSLQRSQSEIFLTVDDSGPAATSDLDGEVIARTALGGIDDRRTREVSLDLITARELVKLHRGHLGLHDSPLGGTRLLVSLPIVRVDPAASPTYPPSFDRATLTTMIDELRAPRGLRRGVQDRAKSKIEKGGQTLARPDAPLAADRHPGAKPRPPERPCVLVVEDNSDMNRFVSQCLSRKYAVVSAFDGRDGFEKALRHRPVLVVSDIMMPNASGVEMIGEMRRHAELKSTPILLLSAKADEELMVRMLEEGAHDFIVKPFFERELLVRAKNLVLAQQARTQMIALRQAAESANRAKDEFLAMLGHELRNPLSPILTALELMKLRGESSSALERTIIEHQVNHLTRLVDDLLDVSRIARGKVELKYELVEVWEVVSKAIEMASPLLEQRRHKLTVNVPKCDLRIHGDTTRLRQVVSNLLTNAAKYTPPGGDIFIGAEAQGNEIILRVRDTGIGISCEVMPRIFDLFVQERQASDRSLGGLGIGLSIVRSLIARHGGSVTAHSEGAGKGSEFIVRLPAEGNVHESTDLISVPPQVRSLSTPPAERAARILVVDDNEDGARLMATALNARGYDARVAHDAPTALRLAQDFSPDTALLDIGLPVMDGYELAARLRELPGLSGLRLIAITGYGQESDRRKAMAAGFHHHLVKPADMVSIEAALMSDGALEPG